MPCTDPASSMTLCNESCTSVGGRRSSVSVPCTARDKLKEALYTYFKHTEFRPGQLESTLPALHGQDVFVRMATGSGKSLCMFLVPLALNDAAMGVVISPLNALMDQQVLVYNYKGEKNVTTYSYFIHRLSNSVMLESLQFV